MRSGATEFVYERKVQPQPKIGPWREELDRLLAVNAARASRERLTLIRIFEELRGLGYDGGYDAVRRYAAGWQRERAAATAAAFVPLSFAPGEAYQFDWSHEVVLIAGVTVTVKVAQFRLCHSRMLFVRAYPRESQEMVFDAHDRAFAFFRGACTRGIYDNMKTAVDAILVGKARDYNRRFQQMCGHYLVEPVACTPASGWEKGQVENQVGTVRQRFFSPRVRVRELRRAERLARRPLRRLGQGAAASGGAGPDDLADVRGGAAEPRALRRALRRLPLDAGLAVEDLPRALRQQQVLGDGERRRPARRGPRLRRPDRAAAGRADRRATSSGLRPRPDRLRSLALCPGAGAQTRRAQQRCALPGLGAAGRDRARAPQAEDRTRRRPADGRGARRGAAPTACRRWRPPAPRR